MKQQDVWDALQREDGPWEEIQRGLDVDYSYRLARRMEQFKTNDALGYRTAGSQAEYRTGQMLVAEMAALGLQVTQDEFVLDGWDFHHARLSYQPEGGPRRTLELGGYQTQMDTAGPRTYELVHAGNATEKELAGLDLRGKLALVFVNQRDDWWINYPAYAAHLKGAAAVIAVQSQGYGEISGNALNAQDICGPREAAAFSLSRNDAARLARELGLKPGGSVRVTFDARSTVTPGAHARNIVGVIPGEVEEMLLVSAHYDSYFAGFQDDNTAVSMMLGMARALLGASYRPRYTLVFCAMAAEEWGVIDSRYDWSTGAYNEIFRVHPQWQGRIVAGINLELPAHAHGKKHKIRSVYELKRFLKAQIAALPPEMHRMYPKGVDVICPVQTWSDDFSLAIGGVPELVNEFGSGKFMETHYHSQFDTDDAYDPRIYAFHHLLYTRLLLAFDQTLLPPLDFSERINALAASLKNQALSPRTEGAFRQAAQEAAALAQRLAKRTAQQNTRYARARREDPAQAREMEREAAGRGAALLRLFRRCEDALVRLNWHEQAQFPHENMQETLDLLHTARWQLAVGEGGAALDTLRQVDDNRYHVFGRAVADYFADRALRQPAERLMWGAGRLDPRVDLTGIIAAIEEKIASGETRFDGEMALIEALRKTRTAALEKRIQEETVLLGEIARDMAALLPPGNKQKKTGKKAKGVKP